MVQEAYATHPAIRAACEREIVGHAATLEADIAAALAAAAGAVDWTPASLALHIQAVLQGAFILAKATGGARGRRRQPRPSPPLPHIALRTEPKGRHAS